MTLPKDNDEVSTWRMPAKPTMADLAKRGIPESWHCIDCGINTAPGCLGRAAYMAEVERQRANGMSDSWVVTLDIDERSEVYCVWPHVWAEAGMPEMGGCLCIGCLETRLGRRLRPKDFLLGGLNNLMGTPRLMNRKGWP